VACHSAGLLRKLVWGHLGGLHKAIKQAEPALVASNPTVQSVGNYEKVSSWKKKRKFSQGRSKVGDQIDPMTINKILFQRTDVTGNFNSLKRRK
jgi:hypothetical protein